MRAVRASLRGRAWTAGKVAPKEWEMRHRGKVRIRLDTDHPRPHKGRLEHQKMGQCRPSWELGLNQNICGWDGVESGQLAVVIAGNRGRGWRGLRMREEPQASPQGSRLGTQNLNLTPPRDGTRKRGSRSEGQAASSGLEALKSKELGEHPGRDAGMDG